MIKRQMYGRAKLTSSACASCNPTDRQPLPRPTTFPVTEPFDLLPRIKRINHLRLYPAQVGWRDAYPLLVPALVNRPIDWGLIADEYDHVIKYAISIKNKTASTAAIPRRFHRADQLHHLRTGPRFRSRWPTPARRFRCSHRAAPPDLALPATTARRRSSRGCRSTT